MGWEEKMPAEEAGGGVGGWEGKTKWMASVN